MLAYLLDWWQMFVYAVLFMATAPVYFLIFLCLFQLRMKIIMFKSTFYAVLLQHNIADLVSLVLYSICRWAFVVTPHIIYENPQLGIASIYYNGLYWAIISRSNGIVLMTLHRYLILVKPVHKAIQHAEPYYVWIVYWVPSIIFSAIIFSDTGIIFDRPDNMALLMDSDIISRATRNSFLYLLVSCLICILTYGVIIKSIRERTQSVSSSFQREIRLAFQVSFFVAALVLLLVYLSLLNLFASIDDKDSIVKTRKYYPIVYGTLSFIGPFTILFFNKDFSRRLRLMLGGRAMAGQSESSLGSRLKQTNIVVTTSRK